jgi:hypothetical protein
MKMFFKAGIYPQGRCIDPDLNSEGIQGSEETVVDLQFLLKFVDHPFIKGHGESLAKLQSRANGLEIGQAT